MPIASRESVRPVADAGSIMELTDAASLIRAARELAPRIEAVRSDIDAQRRIPSALLEDMNTAGMFSLWLPKALNGPELGVVDYVRVIEDLARHDGSVGWCATVAAGLGIISGYLQPDVARQIYGAGRAIMAGSAHPTGKAFAVDGGYRVTGRWGYGSGIQHSNWVVGNCVVHDRDGPRPGLNGVPEMRLAIFPSRAAEVIDTWHVSGLRGTGSHDWRVADHFVQDDHTISFPGSPAQPGTLYAVPLLSALSIAIAAVPLGIARASIDAMIVLATAKTPVYSLSPLRDKATFQSDLGRAEALLGSARAFLIETACDLWDEIASGVTPSMRRRALVRLACTQAAQASAQTVDLMYNAGGGTSLYEIGRLARCFRDVHACTQHIATSTSSYELGGRVLLGLEPGRAQI
jgi:alkylation response protein AidB-like acyl-CoA dehydrogenase